MKKNGLIFMLAAATVGCSSYQKSYQEREPAQTKTESATKAVIESYLNLTATLAQARQSATKESHVCDIGVYENEILASLARAYSYARLDQSKVQDFRRNLAGKSQIKKAIGYTLLYKEAMGAFDKQVNASSNQGSLRAALENTRFYGPAAGAAGYGEYFELKPGERLEWFSVLNDNAEPIPPVLSVGTWKVDRVNGISELVITFEFTDKNSQPQKIQVTPINSCHDGACQWYLSRPIPAGKDFKPDEDIRYWNGLQAECDA